MAGNASSGKRSVTAIRRLHGNPSKRAFNHAEPRPTSGAPLCPAWLSGEARREWRRIVPELDDLGLLARIDRAALAAYCQAWSRFRQAEEMVEKDGMTFPIRQILHLSDGTDEIVTLAIKLNPAVTASQRERQLMKTYLIEFGLTPAARTRLKTPEKQPVDPFAEFGLA